MKWLRRLTIISSSFSNFFFFFLLFLSLSLWVWVSLSLRRVLISILFSFLLFSSVRLAQMAGKGPPLLLLQPTTIFGFQFLAIRLQQAYQLRQTYLGYYILRKLIYYSQSNNQWRLALKWVLIAIPFQIDEVSVAEWTTDIQRQRSDIGHFNSIKCNLGELDDDWPVI